MTQLLILHFLYTVINPSFPLPLGSHFTVDLHSCNGELDGLGVGPSIHPRLYHGFLIRFSAEARCCLVWLSRDASGLSPHASHLTQCCMSYLNVNISSAFSAWQ